MLATVTGQLVEAAGRKNLELLLDIAPEVPRQLFGDELRLGQILLNLGNNAVKFTERGEVTVRARVAERQGDDVLLRFEVQDTGIGLSEEQRAKLFQSFVQADSSISRRFGGTGLGLAISKQLAGLMGGDIGVSSTPGQGSTFWFTVRMKALRPALRRMQLSPDLRGIRVLVVDDNVPSALLMQQLLHRMSFVATAVHSGAEALQALQQADEQGQPYALMVLDWLMPGMNGGEVAQRAQALGLSRVPPVVVVTGLDASDVEAQARAVGVRQVLSKPVTSSSLFDAVLEAFDASGRPGPVVVSEAEVDVSTIAGARVLLVEDNELNQEVALAFLGEAELQVDVAGDGQQALEKVQQAPYDLVLMDMQMPVMDGLSATRAIRQLPGFQALPIVAMTANAMAGDRERCLEAGMNDHIAKPIDPRLLVSKLLQWIAPDPHRPALPRRGPAAQPADLVTGEDLLGIDGLDSALGLRQTGQRGGLYRELLGRFVQDQGDAVLQVEDALAKSDWTAAETLAHTLKGVSAQIGAQPLASAAEALEGAIRQHLPEAAWRPHLDEVRRHLVHLIDALRRRQAEAGQDRADTPVDLDRWPRLRDELVALLQDDNAACEHLYKENEALIRVAMGDRFPAFSRAMLAFDFTRALEQLVD